MKKNLFVNMSVRTMRVLQAQLALNDEVGYATCDQVINQIRIQFKKAYRKEHVIASYHELVAHGFLEQDSTESNSSYIITMEGRTAVSEVKKLSLKSPNPWRKYTRESYSQNVHPS